MGTFLTSTAIFVNNRTVSVLCEIWNSYELSLKQ